MKDPAERKAAAVSAIREVVSPHFDIFDTTEKTNDIVQILLIYRGDDPIGDIREMLEPGKGRSGIESAAVRARVASDCYTAWLASGR
jgi:hypothetical protein